MTETVELWPKGAPDGFADLPPEGTFRMPGAPSGDYDWPRNVSRPTLTVVRAARPNGTGVIICPGGGWRILAWGHEGMDAAHWFAKRGVTAFVLKYRLMATPEDPAKFADLSGRATALEGELGKLSGKAAPRALSQLAGDPVLVQARAMAAADGRQALSMVRDRAAEFGVDPAKVGMMGFSAGAFLTADTAMEPGGAPLAFAVPIYGGDTQGREVPTDARPSSPASPRTTACSTASLRGSTPPGQTPTARPSFTCSRKAVTALAWPRGASPSTAGLTSWRPG